MQRLQSLQELTVQVLWWQRRLLRSVDADASAEHQASRGLFAALSFCIIAAFTGFSDSEPAIAEELV